jgi:hypothetical protein
MCACLHSSFSPPLCLAAPICPSHFRFHLKLHSLQGFGPSTRLFLTYSINRSISVQRKGISRHLSFFHALMLIMFSHYYYSAYINRISSRCHGSHCTCLESPQFGKFFQPRSSSTLNLEPVITISFEFRPSDVPLNHAAYDGTLKVHSKGPLVYYRFVPPSPITIAPFCSFVRPHWPSYAAFLGNPRMKQVPARFSEPQQRPSPFAPVCKRCNPLNQRLGSARINCDAQDLWVVGSTLLKVSDM